MIALHGLKVIQKHLQNNLKTNKKKLKVKLCLSCNVLIKEQQEVQVVCQEEVEQVECQEELIHQCLLIWVDLQNKADQEDQDQVVLLLQVEEVVQELKKLIKLQELINQFLNIFLQNLNENEYKCNFYSNFVIDSS
jgi:hypothetical protein